jgi:hypothetical protein
VFWIECDRCNVWWCGSCAKVRLGSSLPDSISWEIVVASLETDAVLVLQNFVRLSSHHAASDSRLHDLMESASCESHRTCVNGIPQAYNHNGS